MDWLPLVLAAIVGLIIGAIAAYIPLNRQRDEFQYRVRDLDGKLKNNDRDLTDARGQVQSLQAGLRTAETNYTTAQDHLKTAADEKAALDATLREHVGHLDSTRASLADLNMQHADLQTAHAHTHGKLADLHTELEGKVAELDTHHSNLEATTHALAARERDLEKTKFDLDVASSMNTDLESRLQRVRADVAAELALLTTTAIKLKDEALGESNSRVNALTHEMAVLKTRAQATKDDNHND